MAENDGDLQWACSHCPKSKESDLHPYTHKLLRMRTLQQAGYPLGVNDLTLEEWFDLGRINEHFEILERRRLQQKK